MGRKTSINNNLHQQPHHITNILRCDPYRHRGHALPEFEQLFRRLDQITDQIIDSEWWTTIGIAFFAEWYIAVSSGK
jgi:hypothetical protein